MDQKSKPKTRNQQGTRGKYKHCKTMAQAKSFWIRRQKEAKKQKIRQMRL